MLRIWGVLNFDVEIFFPHDPHSSPRGYLKQKSKESDQSHIMTSESLLVQVTISVLFFCPVKFVAYWSFLSRGHTHAYILAIYKAIYCSTLDVFWI